jgi:hypothetical protein
MRCTVAVASAMPWNVSRDPEPPVHQPLLHLAAERLVRTLQVVAATDEVEGSLLGAHPWGTQGSEVDPTDARVDLPVGHELFSFTHRGGLHPGHVGQTASRRAVSHVFGLLMLSGVSVVCSVWFDLAAMSSVGTVSDESGLDPCASTDIADTLAHGHR